METIEENGRQLLTIYLRNLQSSHIIPGLVPSSLNVDPPLTKIPLEEAIKICTDALFEKTEKVQFLSKVEFIELLSLATRALFH